MFKFTKVIMYVAPVAVFASIAFTVGHMGIRKLVNLLKLLATLYGALLVFMLLVLLPVCLSSVFRRVVLSGQFPSLPPPGSCNDQFGSCTPSGHGEDGRVRNMPRSSFSFVLPLGYTLDLDGDGSVSEPGRFFFAQPSTCHWACSFSCSLH